MTTVAFATPMHVRFTGSATSASLTRLRPAARPGSAARAWRVTPRASGGAPPPMPDEARRAAASGEDVQLWQGEWICVDCGYIYKPRRKLKLKFEDLPASWKCPQCNAPKRRFAKKAGDYIAETAGTSNLPIIVFSIGGLVATILFGIWASTQL